MAATTDALDALNLITSSRIHELYESRETEDPLVLRKKAADFRKGYKNWRQKKPKGARGETNYLLDKEKQHASEFQEQHDQIILDAQEDLEAGERETPGLSRAASFGPADAKLEAKLERKESSRSRDRSGSGSLARQPSMSRTKSFKDNSGIVEDDHDNDKENWLKFYVNPYSGGPELTKEPVQLSQSALKVLPSTVLKPHYARPKDKPYVDYYMCHLGVGGFHRSHQCVYTDDLLNAQADPRNPASKGKKWGICGVGLMDWDKKMYETLKSQDYLYTVLSRGHKTNEARVIGSIVDFIFAPEDHQKCIDKLADVKTCIVSLTVTEKGYCQNSAGDLDTKNPFVQADLEGNLAKPKTAIGMIVAALRQRRAHSIPAFTVLSCDNLPENGDKAKHVVLQMAGHINPDLEAWIKSNVLFPNTMVDRITPMTEQEHKDILAHDHKILDGWPVIAEDYNQWVIEDSFVCGRPAWDHVGALLVQNVTPYEFMKLRLLNGGHSALSYAGYMSGYTYVDDAMADPVISGFVSALFREVIPTLLEVPGVNIDEYCTKLIERFSNPYIKDKLQRLAEDGSKKMQNTMRDAIVDLQQRGSPTPTLALANALWIRFCFGEDEEGNIIEIKDPLAVQLNRLAREALSNPEQPSPEAFLLEVHGPELVAQKGFIAEITQHLKSLMTRGSKATIEALVQPHMNGST